MGAPSITEKVVFGVMSVASAFSIRGMRPAKGLTIIHIHGLPLRFQSSFAYSLFMTKNEAAHDSLSVNKISVNATILQETFNSCHDKKWPSDGLLRICRQ